MRTALTIAGSDSGGGAGIQADLKTFAAHGVFGTTALTAVTAQNTITVTRVLPLPTDIVIAQIDAVLTDIGADATKIGMLATGAIASAVAAALRRYNLPHVVLDTVMVAKGGARLLDDEGVAVIRDELLALADLVTVNVPEAEALTGLTVRNVVDGRQAAEQLVKLGARAVLVKGGHLEGPTAVDVLFDGDAFWELSERRVQSVHTHGTGCTLAAAITARLSLGDTLIDAVRAAKSYVTRAIADAPGLGHGHGPLAHAIIPDPRPVRS
jgi:hydroxymethylpyrimidine/phosphomethylpyrimidine kinase